ncbi:MAG: SBBP repeat-containing protein, partial [candidate division WOR-3 bacterium]
MHTFKYIFASILLIFCLAYARVDTTWVQRYNASNDTDYARAIVVDTAGNVYVTGIGKSLSPLPNFDIFTIKYNTNGALSWWKKYDDPDNGNDYVNAITIDKAGNVYIAGCRYSPLISYDYLVVKYNNNGFYVWDRTYDGPGHGIDEVFAIAVDSLKNVYVTGKSQQGSSINENYDIVTIKYDSLGTAKWIFRYNASANQNSIATGLVLWKDTVYVTGSLQNSITGYDFITIKHLPNGDTAWTKIYTNPGDDYPNAIAIDNQGNVYVTGQISNGIDADYGTVKYSPTGEQTVYNFYNGVGNGADVATGIVVDGNGFVYVTGYSYGGGLSDYDIVTLKYDQSGVIIDTLIYDGIGNGDDRATGIVVNNLGYIYVTGYITNAISPSAHDYITLKYNAENGRLLWATNYDYGNTDEANGIAVDPKGNVYITGKSFSATTSFDFATIKYGVIKDVGVVSIISPQGIIDSTATTLIPSAVVRNNGSEIESFSADFKIGSFSSTKLISNLYPEDSTIVYFDNPGWTIGPRGNYIGRCSTYLNNDTFLFNDTLSCSFTIQVRDYAATNITSPTSPIDSGTTITPKAWIRNYGTRNESDSAQFYIVGTSYVSSKLVTLNAGDSIEQAFDDFTVNLPRGTYTMRCTTKLTGDMIEGNNLTVGTFTIRVKDFAVSAITTPTNIIDSGSTVTPKAWIHNLGTHSESDSVQFSIIGTGYQNSKLVTLAAGDSVEQHFDDLVVDFARGKYFVQCSTKLSGDFYETNNFKTDSFMVRVCDVGVIEIISPVGNIDSGNTIVPQAKVKNFGSEDASFYVTLRIGSWSNTQEVIALPPNNEETVTFAPWQVGPRGFYTIKCSTRLTNDIVFNNDTLTSTFSVNVRDYAAKSIILSATVIDSAMIVMLKAWIHNYGSTNESDSVNLYIPGTSYSSTKLVTLNAGDSIEVDFDDFIAHVPSNIYIVKCTTRLNGDIVPFNNLTTCNLKVVVPGWRMAKSLPEIGRGVKDGGCLTAINDTIYALQGANTRNFFRYLPVTDSWVLCCSIPYALRPDGRIAKKNVKSGGALTANKNVIYAFKGNNTNEFWAYYPELDSWIQKASIPEYAAFSTKSTKVKAGAALTIYLDSIYAFKGGNTNEFWVYEVNSDTWYQRKSLIVYDGANLKKIKAGGALTVNGCTLYAFIGGSTNFFYCYLPGQDTWIRLADASFGTYATIRKKIKDGAALVAYNNKIYALKGGNTQDFGCYDIATNTWTLKETIPSTPAGKKVKAGGALTVTNGQLYAFKGGNSFEFWKYTFSTLPEQSENKIAKTIHTEINNT